MKAQKKKRITVPNAAMVTDRYSDREQNAGREMDAEGVAGEGSDGDKQDANESWREEFSTTVSQNLAEVCSSVLLEVERTSDKHGYLTEGISKQVVGEQLFLLDA